jgi:Domain of unknown function (DUF3846)
MSTHTFTGITIDTDGTVTETVFSPDYSLQDAVGGYIELFEVGDLTFIANEDGLNKGLPLNLVATRLASMTLYTEERVLLGGMVGPVVILGLMDPESYDDEIYAPVSATTMETLTILAAHVTAPGFGDPSLPTNIKGLEIVATNTATFELTHRKSNSVVHTSETYSEAQLAACILMPLGDDWTFSDENHRARATKVLNLLENGDFQQFQ